MQEDLIFDVGMHRGEDTEFYLRKGFRVVAVEADPLLCAEVAERLQADVARGALKIVDRAIDAEAGEVTFYRNALYSVWSTIDPDWVRRNEANGGPSVATRVPATTLAAVIAAHGVPYYLKLDIEGLDRIALAGLRDSATRPRFVSIESEKVDFEALLAEFSLLRALGYDRFKVVPQHRVTRQKLPDLPREGRYYRHRFAWGSSGAFGEESPGRWLTEEEAILVYRRIFRRYGLIGDSPSIRNPLLRRLVSVVTGPAGWYDTHAKRAEGC